MLRMCKDVLDTDQDGSTVSMKWSDNMELRSPHFVLTEHTLVYIYGHDRPLVAHAHAG